MHHRQLGLAAAADHGHHAVALREARRARAQAHHLAGQLEPRDVGRRARRRRIGAAALEHVGAVQAGPAHAHEHLSVARLGVRALLDDELLSWMVTSPHPEGTYSVLLCNGRVPADD